VHLNVRYEREMKASVDRNLLKPFVSAVCMCAQIINGMTMIRTDTLLRLKTQPASNYPGTETDSKEIFHFGASGHA